MTQKHFSPLRVATGFVLAAWAFALGFIYLAGRSSYYLSPRTSWVIPVGAVLLGVTAIGRLATTRTSGRPEPIPRREAIILGLFLLPVALLLIVPPQTLSSYAVNRRPAFATGVSSSGSDIGTGTLTMLEVAGAQSTRRGIDELATHAGEQVSFQGFVTRTPTTPADEFTLNRFVISCCAADAQSANIRVVDVPPGTFDIDEWVQVDGTIYPIGRTVIIQADSVTSIPEPAQPYLTP